METLVIQVHTGSDHLFSSTCADNSKIEIPIRALSLKEKLTVQERFRELAEQIASEYKAEITETSIQTTVG